MNNVYYFYLTVFSVVTELVLEWVKSEVRTRALSSNKFKKFYETRTAKNMCYAFGAILPSGILGILLTRLTSDNWNIANYITNGLTIYVVQYLFGVSLVSKLRDNFDKKITNL